MVVPALGGIAAAGLGPGRTSVPWRTILRHRGELVAAARQHVPDIDKALTQVNLEIHHVIRDITAVTGLAIVDAILAGQRTA